MRVALVVPIVLAACGRWDFEDRPLGDAANDDAGADPDGAAGDRDASIDVMSDALSGHDEDSDGWPDAFDNCPGLANPTQTNSDTDAVGDACDREPTLGRQTIVIFAPMTGADARFEMFSPWVVGSEFWTWDGSANNGVNFDVPVSETDLYVGVRVVSTLTGARQIGVHVSPNPVASFYAEIYQAAGGQTEISATRNDTTNGYVSLDKNPIGVFPTGRLELHFASRAATDSFSLDVDAGGTPYAASGTDVDYAAGTRLTINMDNLAVELHYIMVIRTQ